MNYGFKEHKKYSRYKYICATGLLWSLICVRDPPSTSRIVTPSNLIHLLSDRATHKCLVLLLAAVEVTQFWRFAEPRSQTCLLQSADEVVHHTLVASSSRLPAGVGRLSSSSSVELRRTEQTPALKMRAVNNYHFASSAELSIYILTHNGNETLLSKSSLC